MEEYTATPLRRKRRECNMKKNSDCHICKHFEELAEGGICWWKAKEIREAQVLSKDNIKILQWNCQVYEEMERR